MPKAESQRHSGWCRIEIELGNCGGSLAVAAGDEVNPDDESEEYRRQQERAGRLFDAIGALLPEEGRAMFLEYGEALGAAHCLETEIVAEHAFLDGMRTVMQAVMSYEC